jgi:6-phosphogluconolactonase
MSDRTDPERIIAPDADLLAAAIGARFITALADAQAARGIAHAVLTGGSGGNSMMKAVADSSARDSIDWSRVELWWGDERFAPSGDPDRNEGQARGLLLDQLPLDPARVHAMAPSDGPYGEDVDRAAEAYAEELAKAAGEPGGVPAFDVLLLGVGPDGHVASLFPGHPGFAVTTGTAIAVRNSPKPPPTRISLTLPALQTARQTWLLAAGAGKADAVARALSGEPLPCGSVHGTERTIWMLDRDSAPKG